MPALTFSKWSPGGNSTLFFAAQGLTAQQQTALARTALESPFLGGEQAGFVDLHQRRLRMAGGEFCVNASRAFGALLAFTSNQPGPAQAQLEGLPQPLPDPEHQQHFEIQVSGWPSPVRLNVRGRAPRWQVEAVLRLPACPIQQVDRGMALVRLPGIVHILFDSSLHPFPEDCTASAALLRQRCHLEQEPAVGTIWWRQQQGLLDMLPLVYVRDARTTCLESACGSGALALSLYLASASGTQARACYSIMQPGGSALDVRLFQEGRDTLAGIDGPVELVARGQFWPPQA